MADTSFPRIAILGTGNVGGSLGGRLAEVGVPVVFGVRPESDVAELLGRCAGRASAASPAEAVASADLIFVALPTNAALPVLEAAGPLDGKIVVDCTNPVAWQNGPVLAPPPAGSVAATLALAFPGARLVKGFNTFGAEHHRHPGRLGRPLDVPLAGDDAAAKAVVIDLARHAGFHAYDAGPLRNAGLLEALAVLWIHLATQGGLGRHIAFRLEGTQEPET